VQHKTTLYGYRLCGGTEKERKGKMKNLFKTILLLVIGFSILSCSSVPKEKK